MYQEFTISWYITMLKPYSVWPSMNSLRMEVGGMAAISAGDRATIYPRNFSRRTASV